MSIGIATQPGQFAAAAAAPPSGTGLLTGLREWWEDASPTGKHASLVWSDVSNWTPTAGGPNGLDYWVTPQIIAESGQSWTAGHVTLGAYVRGGTPGDNSGCGLGLERELYMRNRNTDQYTVQGLFGLLGSASFSNWNSFVFTVGDGAVSSWLNGVPLDVAKSTAKTFPYPIRRHTTGAAATDMAVAAIWDRAFTTADAEEFHNSGSLRTYADL